MSNDELADQKLRVETRKMLADMEHNIKQQIHWDSNQKHWRYQQYYWLAALAFTAAVLLAKPFLDGWAKSYFGV